jgi:hypothetical protein
MPPLAAPTANDLYRLCSVSDGRRRSWWGRLQPKTVLLRLLFPLPANRFLVPRSQAEGRRSNALPARPPGRLIDGERPLLLHTACSRVWQLSGVLLGLPVRLAGNVRPQVHERSPALPEGRAAIHALRMQLRPARGMELPWAVLSVAGQRANPPSSMPEDRGLACGRGSAAHGVA